MGKCDLKQKRSDCEICFLGIADYFEDANTPFPYGAIDIFQLSQHKGHIIYPISIQTNTWIFMVSTEFFKHADIPEWELRIVCPNRKQLAKINFDKGIEQPPKSSERRQTLPNNDLPVVMDSKWQIVTFSVGVVVSEPGIYVIESLYKDSITHVGSVEFHYRKAPPFTPDHIKAIESNPSSVKAIWIDLGCDHCPAKLFAYTGLQRLTQLEAKGYLWQSDLPEQFSCDCGRTKHTLKYLKESMHGMLLKNFDIKHSNLSYVRRYGHTQVKEIVDKYTEVLCRAKLEKPVQMYIEQNPVLLSRFQAKRLFVKPQIPGQFEADFAIVDTRNQLWFIELEKPTLKLFRQDGHPAQGLMHAYGQVTDWLHQYGKHPGAVLEALGLTPAEVTAVRGAVIAGRSLAVTHQVLQRHLSNPPYPNIDFMTCDDLAMSLLEISKNIA